MKTNKILTSVCVTAALAACTNEQFIENANNSNTLEGRKVVDLEIVAGEETNSRVAVNEEGEFLWTPEDKLGAVIVDPTTLNTVARDKTLGNNRFQNNLTENSKIANFYTDGTTVEGAWMFYSQYRAEQSSKRDGIHFPDVTSNQKYDKDGSLMAKNDFKVTPVTFVEANEGGEATKIQIKPVSIYGYGIINAKFPTSVTKVNRVLLQAADNFNVAGKINAEAVAEIAALNYTSKTDASGGAFNGKGYAFKTNEDGTPDVDAAYNALAGVTETYNTPASVDGIFQSTPTTTGNILVECTDEEGNGASITNGEFYTRLLIPAGYYSNDITLYFYTNDGIYTKTVADPLVKRNHYVNLANPNRTTTTEGVDPKNAVMDLTDEDDKVTDGSAPIATTEDLISVIKSTNNGARELDLSAKIVDGAGVEFNEEVAKALAANTTIDNIKFNTIDIVNNSETPITLSRIYATAANVKKGSFIYNNNNTIVTLNIQQNAKVSVVNYGGSASSVNVFGELDVVSSTLTSTTINVKDGGNLTLTGKAATGEIVNTLTLSKALTIEAGATAEIPEGSTVILGTTASSNLTKAAITSGNNAAPAGKLTVNGKLSVNVASCETNGEIINNGEISATTGISLQNDGTITNYGRIESINNDSGTVIAKAGSFNNFKSNRGKVDNSDSRGKSILEQASYSGDNGSSDVFVTISGETLTNDFLVDGNFPISERVVLDKVNWNVNSEITVSKNVDFVASTLTLTKGGTNGATASKVTFNSNVNILNGKSSWVSAYDDNKVIMGNSKALSVGSTNTDKATLYLKGLTVEGTSSSTFTVYTGSTVDNWGNFVDTNFSTITIPTGSNTGTTITTKP